jgi:hypothetical protein
MVDYGTANARISSFSTFLAGLSVITLLLSVNLMTARVRQLTPSLFAAETVLFLLTAMVLFFSATATLVSAYFEAGVGVDLGVRRARRFIVSGVVLTILALSGVFLAVFDFTAQALLYAASAGAAAVAFVTVRRRQGIPL